ncbi:hypothetical protein SAMN05216303_102305 [Rhodoferax sp. OV413]|uniref:phage fiber-tail adaptor protein n=1 Tax=Rhodoferax sp. OV413 TaxID=1855285 RepID=UPI000890A0BE|nr:hypothetical protein [Rhodoferax sp. OV413]SDO76836.1 hypothetical protein SAMN05216303_102305 [Rhodoferax sp. OV413]
MSAFNAAAFSSAFYVVDAGTGNPTPDYDCDATGRAWFASWKANGWLWPVKFSEERITAKFDFTKDLTYGDKIATVDMVVTVMRGTDPTPAALRFGVPVIKGGRVLQKLGGGVPGCTYKVLCRATTVQNDILLLAGVLPVQSL